MKLITFLLNNKLVNASVSPGMTVLDFVRHERNLKGTKIGCREGDCGACTVLVGKILEGELIYQSVTSCLMPVANANGKHIVTIEGINIEGLNAVQQAMSDEGATQCGFCTPGFVMSLAGYCLQNRSKDVVASIDGNICRCTGYKSIERAAKNISELISKRSDADIIDYAVENKIIPEYFLKIKERLNNIELNKLNIQTGKNVFVGGGTDLYVQKHEEMVHASAEYLSDKMESHQIIIDDNRCVIGASATVTDLIESPVIRKIFPEFLTYSKLVSSTPIRNMASIGGNFVNASPIGDFTVFFLALDAKIILNDGNKSREINLRDFYKGYKTLDKSADEYIESLSFKLFNNSETKFNFEKVSKRTNLDIASVNSGIKIKVENNLIVTASISCGGVGPVPTYLKKSSDYLPGKQLSGKLINEVCEIASTEITPISDARGAAEYKTLLLQQLIRAHFIKLYPQMDVRKILSQV